MDLIREELTTLFMRSRATRRDSNVTRSKQTERNNEARRKIECMRDMKEVDNLFVC